MGGVWLRGIAEEAWLGGTVEEACLGGVVGEAWLGAVTVFGADVGCEADSAVGVL